MFLIVTHISLLFSVHAFALNLSYIQFERFQTDLDISPLIWDNNSTVETAIECAIHCKLNTSCQFWGWKNDSCLKGALQNGVQIASQIVESQEYYRNNPSKRNGSEGITKLYCTLTF